MSTIIERLIESNFIKMNKEGRAALSRVYLNPLGVQRGPRRAQLNQIGFIWTPPRTLFFVNSAEIVPHSLESTVEFDRLRQSPCGSNTVPD